MLNSRDIVFAFNLEQSAFVNVCSARNIHVYKCKFFVRVVITYLLSKIVIQLGPQIKLWKRGNVEIEGSKNIAKLEKNAYFCHVLWYRKGIMGAASTTNVAKDSCMMDENEVDNGMLQKRQTMAQVTMSQKKAKGKLLFETKFPFFWLGFQVMIWTNKKKDYPIDNMELISDLIRKGMEIDEAIECQQENPSFPIVIQEEWPSKRVDGKEGQHFNLTQIPFDVEVDAHGFSLNYHIAIAFEIGTSKWSKDVIMEKIKIHLDKMKIEMEEMISESIAMMCYHKSTNWGGIIKNHLKDPKKDGSALLQGFSAFILTLDENMWLLCILYFMLYLARRGKVFKSYNALTLNNLLTVKIVNKKLKEKE